MSKKFNMYEMERIPVKVYQMTSEEMAEFLCISQSKCYLSTKKEHYHNGKYLITQLDDVRKNRYADALMYACAELAHFTNESTEGCIRRMMARAMLNSTDYEIWMKQYAKNEQ